MTTRLTNTVSGGLLAAFGAVCLLAAPVAGSLPAQGSEAESFYEGQTIRFIIPRSPGGGVDWYGRNIARFMDRHMPNTRVTPVNVPGGGGVIGDNQAYLSDPDGLTVWLTIFPGHVLAQLTGQEGVQYDFTQWEWIGRISDDIPAVSTSTSHPWESFEEVVASEEEVRLGALGAGSHATYALRLIADVFDFPARLVTGYPGTPEANAALMRGEVDIRYQSMTVTLPFVEEGEFRALAVLSDERHPEMPELPTLVELAPDDQARDLLLAYAALYQLERVVAAPPNTPADRVEYLREVFMQVMNDPEFQEMAEAAGNPLVPLDGARVAEIADRLAGQVDRLLPIFAE
jgi:tripartite-type tricarboxylate transporter receptor subunit TctC